MPQAPRLSLAARAYVTRLLGPAFGPELTEDMLESFRPITTHEDTQILRAGDVADRIFVLMKGAARMSYYRRGKEHIGDFFLEGEIFTDYSSLVTHAPSRFHLTSMGPCQLLTLTRDDYERIGARLPAAFERGARLIAEQNAVNFAQRIWSSLMDSPAERFATIQREKPAWLERFPQYMIASYLGLTPEGLSKLRKRLER
jgi:CRP-like cAMP-binding protein